MKRLKKVFAIILAVIMTASLLCVPISAADDTYACFNEGTGYVALGDSFTRGYGAGDDWQNEIYTNDRYGDRNDAKGSFYCRNVKASYPNLVANELGLYAPDDIRDTSATFWNLAHDAVSTSYVNDLLGIDDGYRDDEFTYDNSWMTDRYVTDLRYYGCAESYTLDGQARLGDSGKMTIDNVEYNYGEIMSVRDLLKNAKLITIELGQSDIIYKAQLFGLNTLDMSDIAGLPAGIAHIVELINTYYDQWTKAYPLLLDFIKENNPDAKVVLVGTLNPLKNATITDEVGIKIGFIIDGIMDKINCFTQQCAVKYGYSYVDISDVDTPTKVTQMSITHILGITDDIEYGLIAHPTTNGYKQISERVISVIQDELKKDTANSFEAFFLKIINFIKTFFKTVVSRLGSSISA